MSIKYEIIKRIVKAVGMKKMWSGKSADEIIAVKKKENEKNRIPELSDPDFEISRFDVMGFTVIKMVHKNKSPYANLFIIGGGMVMAPRPDAVKKALKFAKETGADVYVPYYPLCTDYPLTKAYEMIHETYKTMLKDYSAENISVLGTSSGGNLALGIKYDDDHYSTDTILHIIYCHGKVCCPWRCYSAVPQWEQRCLRNHHLIRCSRLLKVRYQERRLLFLVLTAGETVSG